jgi:hypothetical protein
MSRGHDNEVHDSRVTPHSTPRHGEHPTDTAINHRDQNLERSTRPVNRQVHRSGDQTYHLRDSEISTLTEIAKFRAIRTEDLIRIHYRGDAHRASSDLRNLTAQRLIEKRTSHGREPGQLVSVTRQAKNFIERHRSDGVSKDQAFHQGFVKPREARHDAALYRLYHKAAEEIERAGGKNLRVVLDFELKKDLYRDIAKLRGLSSNEQEDQKQEIAQAHGLRVVNGKIPLPDLRIEYENKDHEQSRLDLELATSDYRGHQLAEKAQAGFSIYAPADEAGRIRAALRDPHLMTEILSL